MDDFLHNLRMQKDRRFERGRKPYDSNSYKKGRSPDNRKGNYRKTPGVEQITSLLIENLPELKTKLDELVEQQKRLAVAGERRADAEERKASAIEQIANAFNHSAGFPLPGSLQEKTNIQPPLPVIETTSSADENEAGDPPSESAIIDLIQAMRARGLSYSRIAEDLNAQNMPTSSGRGQWRGPMVSKLCRELE